MTDTSQNNKRIAKNTLLLYLRMSFTMLVGLYTSRVILATLGVEDFGIYNVVGGVVAMFGFINSAMASGTQRFLTFELGCGDMRSLKTVFCTSVLIHSLIALLIIVLGETVGLWFFYEKLVIPVERMEAALWTYQFSILSTVVMIMSVPYNAVIIAHEKMSAFAYISVLEVVLKLVIVYMLIIGDIDKLILYAVLTFLVQLFICLVYSSYCKRHFEESKFSRKSLKGKFFCEMIGFSSWNLWGSCAAIAFTQGLNILLNVFWGPVVNAARGVAVQVQSAVIQLSMNFQTALNPQITKSFATGNRPYMYSLIYRSSKFTFFLLLFLSLPVMFETETILRVWLKTVPEYTVIFLRLMLCVTIIDAVANPLMVSAAATGKVKLYQGVVGGILLCILPISYVVLKFGGNPASVFIVHLCVCIIAFIARLYIIHSMIGLVLSDYVKKVVLLCAAVGTISLIIPLIVKLTQPNDTWFSFFVTCFACVFSVSLCVFFLGLTVSERRFILDKLSVLKFKNRK